MTIIGQSAKHYQERRQPNMQQTLRGPGPQVYLQDNAVHTLTLEPPLPAPDLLHNPQPTDGTLTQVWPHGDTTDI